MTLPDFSDEGQDLSANSHSGDLLGNEQVRSTNQTQSGDASPPSSTSKFITLAEKSIQSAWRLIQAMTAQLAAQQANPSSRRRLGGYVQLATGAIAIALFLFLGWNNQQLKRSLRLQEQQLAAANSAIDDLEQQQIALNAVLANFHKPQAAYSLQGTGELANAAGSLVTIAAENKAFLIVPDLPSLPDGEVYRFWATTDSKSRLMYCGQFTVDQTNFVEWSLPDPACSQQATRALVTIDPITASTAAEGKIVLQNRAIQPTN